jgi:hypothetical protein
MRPPRRAWPEQCVTTVPKLRTIRIATYGADITTPHHGVAPLLGWTAARRPIVDPTKLGAAVDLRDSSLVSTVTTPATCVLRVQYQPPGHDVGRESKSSTRPERRRELVWRQCLLGRDIELQCDPLGCYGYLRSVERVLGVLQRGFGGQRSSDGENVRGTEVRSTASRSWPCVMDSTQ